MDPDVHFGQIALKHKLLNKKQHDEAFRALQALRKKLGKKAKRRPRLVDVLVQKKLLTGTQARQVENARLFRERRMQDKVYARIAIKSKFCESKQVDKCLAKQKAAYLEGEEPPALGALLLEKNWINEEQDEAIRAALDSLDVEQYITGRKGKKGKAAAAPAPASEEDEDEDEDDELDEEELEEIEDEDGSGSKPGVVEELSGLEVDLDLEEASGSLDDGEAVEELDSNIDDAISGLDIDEASASASKSAASKPKKAPAANVSAPHGLSSDLDIGSGIDLELEDDDDDAAASGSGAPEEASASDDLGSDLELDLDDDD